MRPWAALIAACLIAVTGCGGSTHVAGLATTGGAATTATTGTSTAPPATDDFKSLRPPIKKMLIPFGAQRKREMTAYAKRHYGAKYDYHLNKPQVIVEHVAVAPTAQAIYGTFAPDHPDPELHELPNVCSHFAVDRDGTIYQFVPIGIMCRHTVGLNYTAIGIEHAGFSDSDVLNDPRELNASLKLTRWLRCSQGVKIANVIGHNESLSSPFHMENVASLRNQTHGDMNRASMNVYRRKLAALPCTG